MKNPDRIMATQEPLISIITVTYNAQETLPATIASVNGQTWGDYEYIIVDGASKDGTLEYAMKHASGKTRIISEPDKGLYDAMNKGIGLSRGKYLIFLNAGDSFHDNETLSKISKAIIDNDYPGIIYGQTQLVDIHRNRIADRHLKAPEKLTYSSFADGMVVCHQAFVVLSCIAPLFNLRFRFSADYDWCIQCLQHSRQNVLIPEVTIDYLSEGVTTANHKASLFERFKIMCYYYGTARTLFNHMKFLPRYFAHKRKIRKSGITNG